MVFFFLLVLDIFLYLSVFMRKMFFLFWTVAVGVGRYSLSVLDFFRLGDILWMVIFKWFYHLYYVTWQECITFFFFKCLRVCLVHVFKNWKLLFKNFCENTCGWNSVWKYVKCCLKTKNCCLETLAKHPLTCEESNGVGG